MSLQAPEYSFGGGDVVGVLFPIAAGLGSPSGSASLITGAGTAISSAINATSTAGQIGAAITAGFDVAALASGPAAPVVAAIGNLIGPIIAQFSGCGSTCTQATAIANNIGGPMAQAFDAYMSAPVHYYSAQQTFLAYFQTLMAQLNQACSNPALGTAGKNCIADNSPGACHWKASPGGWSQNADGTYSYTPWGPAGSGGACWNPYTGIYNMVLNDPTVVPDPVSASAGTTGPTAPADTTATPAPDSTWLIVGVVAALAAFIFL